MILANAGERLSSLRESWKIQLSHVTTICGYVLGADILSFLRLSSVSVSSLRRNSRNPSSLRLNVHSGRVNVGIPFHTCFSSKVLVYTGSPLGRTLWQSERRDSVSHVFCWQIPRVWGYPWNVHPGRATATVCRHVRQGAWRATTSVQFALTSVVQMFSEPS